MIYGISQTIPFNGVLCVIFGSVYISTIYIHNIMVFPTGVKGTMVITAPANTAVNN